MYKLLLFDADGTILDYKASEKYALENTLKSLNNELDFEEILPVYKEINSAIWQEFESGLITADLLRWKRFERLLQRLDIAGDPKEMARQYLEFFGSTGYILPSTHEVLSYLQERYQLALITNGLKDVQYSRLDNGDVRKYFSTIIISDEVGAQKPDPKIFDILFEKSGHTEKASSLIIGDSLSSDIAGGAGYGIDTCWIKEKNEENKSDLIPTYEIEHLDDLYTIL